MKIKLLAVACLLVGVTSLKAETTLLVDDRQSPDIEHGEVLLMSYFRGNGEAGVYMALSEDGLKYTPLNEDQPIMRPPAWNGQKLTRDPSLIYHEGLFHMVWTTNWQGNCFGYATSQNLVTWSKPVQVYPFSADLIPQRTWAPEICWDPFQKNYMIFWAAYFNDNDGHQIFLTRTSDGKNFSEAQKFLNRDFRCIDSMLCLDEENDRWVMIYKNEIAVGRGGKNLRVATAPLDFSSPWVDLGNPIIGPGSKIYPEAMTEGPSLLKTDTGWNLYWDSPTRKKYGMASSTDLVNWKDRSAELTLPKKLRHGTVFLAPTSAVGWLDESTNP